MARLARGFTLIEIAITLVVITVLAAAGLSVLNGLNGIRERTETKDRLSAAENALKAFAMRERHLPCPAIITLPASDANAGVAIANCNTSTVGALPWRTLGLSSDQALDGWGRQLTYKVAPALTAADALDASECVSLAAAAANLSPSGRCQARGAACNSGSVATCTPLSTYVAKLAGGAVLNQDNSPLAYALISHGEVGAGAYSSEGILQTAGDSDVGSGERTNASSANNVVFATYSEAAGPGHYDDMVRSVDITTLIVQGGFQPLPLAPAPAP